MRGTFQGTWQTTDGPGLGPVIVIAAVLLLCGSGVAAAIATAVMTLLIVAGAVVVLTAAGLAALLVYRVRQGPPAVTYRAEVIPETRQHLAGSPTRIGTARADFALPAIEAPAHRELHLHLHGIDPEQVAEILRRHERPEQ